MCAVEWKALSEIFEMRGGYTPSTKNKDFWEDGILPWFRMEDIREKGNILSDSTLHITPTAVKKNGLFPQNSIILATSATIGEHALLTVPALSNQRFTAFYPKEKYVDRVNCKFAYYVFYLIDEWCKNNIVQGGFASVDMTGLKKYLFPIPSLAKQQEIVSQLDTFTTLIFNLESELDMRRKQYEHYRNQLLDFEGVEGVEWKPYAKIGTITDYVSNGSFADLRNNVEYKQAVDYAILVRTVDFSTNFDKSKLVYIDEKAYNFLSKSKLFGGEIIINNIGAGVGSTFICPQLGQPMSLAPNAIMLNTPNNKFYYYWFVSKYGQDKMMSIVAKSAMPKFNKTGFKGLEVPIPSSETQQQIVEKLDAFEQLIQSLETEIKLRKQQYEYYREKLLTFEK